MKFTSFAACVTAKKSVRENLSNKIINQDYLTLRWWLWTRNAEF